MNFDIYTNKSKEAIQDAQRIATQNHNQQLEQIHLLSALLRQRDGLVPQLLKKMGVTLESMDAAANGELQKVPAVSGSVNFDQMYADSSVISALNAAENELSPLGQPVNIVTLSAPHPLIPRALSKLPPRSVYRPAR